METDYPVDGHVKISVHTERPVAFTLRTRNPGWANSPCGYTSYTHEWKDDVIELCFDMPICLHKPEHWEEDIIYTDMSHCANHFHYADPMKVFHQEEEDHYIAVTRGPLTLGADSRTGKAADSVFTVSHQAEMVENTITADEACLLKLQFAGGGEPFYLVDYASAGRDWETVIAAWLPTK